MADDNTDSWMGFAQRSRDDGGLGLAPHQAAGLVGNLQNESGSSIPAWGPTGDNGSAWGTAQWRGDRLDNLKSYAADNGLDHRSVEAQQAFMRHEFDTTENSSYKALQAAQTPEAAATAVNTQYERSADRSGNRERAARALMDGPTAIDAAMGRTRSTGSQAMAYAAPDPTVTPPALNQQQPQGALTAGGQPVSPNNWDTFAQMLKDMAPGIAQDPAHAQVLEAAANATRPAKAVAGTWSVHTFPDGTVGRVNNQTGIVLDNKGVPITGDHSKEEGKYGIVTPANPVTGAPAVMGYPPSREDWKATQTPEAKAAADQVSADAAKSSSLTGPEFMDSLTQNRGSQYANSIQAILDGRALMPTASSRQPGAAQLRADALQADHTLQEGTGPARVKLRQSYETATAPGSPAQQIRMGNVALDHGGNLSDEIEAVKAFHDHADSEVPGVSYGLNWAHNKTLAGQSSPEAQAYTALQTHINNFASEKAKFLGGGVAGEHEKQRILDLYDMNKSLPELRAGMAADAKDVMAKGDELQNSWRTGNDNSQLVKDFPIISKEGQAGYDRIIERHSRTEKGGYVTPGSSTAAPSTKPATGTFKDVPWSIK